jgi:hypothetical protein
MGRANKNITRALCACVFALAIHATAPTAQGAGGFTVLTPETASSKAAADAQWKTSLSQWEANMLTYGQIYCNTMITGKDRYGNVLATEVDFGGRTYYDALAVYLQVWQYTKDAKWLPCIDAMRLHWRDRYVLLAPQNGGIPGYWNFTTGLTMDALLNGDMVSKNAAITMSKSAAFTTDATPLAWTASPFYVREVAYAVRSYLDAEKLGQPRRARLADMVAQLYNDIDEWFISKKYRVPAGSGSWDGQYYIAPFMPGLAMESLIMWHEASNDPKVLPAVKVALDWLWDNAWVPNGGAFWYDNRPGSSGVIDPNHPWTNPPWDPSNPMGNFPYIAAPDLNLIIAPAYAWYYKMTGDTTYRDRGDAIFGGGVRNAQVGWDEKIFNQNYLYSFKYVEWRRLAEGGSAPVSVLSPVQAPASAPAIAQPEANVSPAPQAPASTPVVVPQAPTGAPASVGSSTPSSPEAPKKQSFWRFFFGK